MDMFSYLLGKQSGGSGGGDSMYNLEDYVTIDWENMAPYSGSETHYVAPCTMTEDNFNTLNDLVVEGKNFYVLDGTTDDDTKIIRFTYTLGRKTTQYPTGYEISMGSIIPSFLQMDEESTMTFEFFVNKTQLNQAKLHMYITM